jgi:hypothetical protein
MKFLLFLCFAISGVAQTSDIKLLASSGPPAERHIIIKKSKPETIQLLWLNCVDNQVAVLSTQKKGKHPTYSVEKNIKKISIPPTLTSIVDQVCSE